ncbi:hypothetical protein D3C74_368770 [compost metagenome]
MSLSLLQAHNPGAAPKQNFELNPGIRRQADIAIPGWIPVDNMVVKRPCRLFRLPSSKLIHIPRHVDPGIIISVYVLDHQPYRNQCSCPHLQFFRQPELLLPDRQTFYRMCACRDRRNPGYNLLGLP